MEKFLEKLSRCGVVGDACALVNVSRQNVEKWREKNPVFDRAYCDAIESAVDRVERRAMEIAANGCEEPVYQGGKLVGTKLVFETGLMQFVLKTRRKEVYGEKVAIEHSGAVGHLTLDEMKQRMKDAKA